MSRVRKALDHVCAALLLAGLSSLAPSGAQAELRPVFDQLKLFNSPVTAPEIEVEAEGKDWIRVSTQTLHITTNYFVSLKKGQIITISATFGYALISQNRHPGGGKRRWGTFNLAIPNSQMGILKDAAVNACNQKKDSGARTDETHTAYVSVPFTLFVRAERVGNQSTKTVDGDVQAKVVCKKAPKQVEISSLHVQVDDAADTCPKAAVVQVGFETNRNESIDFTLEHMNRAPDTTEHFAEPFLIGGQYVATKRIELFVDSNTEYVRVRLNDGSDSESWVVGGPLGQRPPITCPRELKVTSARLNYKVEEGLACPKRVQETARFKATAPGRVPFEVKTQAGLVVHSGTADFRLEGMDYVAVVKRDNLSMNAFESDMMALITSQPDANSGWVRLKVECLGVLSGALDLRGFPARCEGEAALSIRTNMTGNVPYQLDCTGQRSWSGTAQSQQTDPETYIGVDVLRFPVSNNEQVNCALKTRSPLPTKILALQGRKFECH